MMRAVTLRSKQLAQPFDGQIRSTTARVSGSHPFDFSHEQLVKPVQRIACPSPQSEDAVAEDHSGLPINESYVMRQCAPDTREGDERALSCKVSRGKADRSLNVINRDQVACMEKASGCRRRRSASQTVNRYASPYNFHTSPMRRLWLLWHDFDGGVLRVDRN